MARRRTFREKAMQRKIARERIDIPSILLRMLQKDKDLIVQVDVLSHWKDWNEMQVGMPKSTRFYFVKNEKFFEGFRFLCKTKNKQEEKTTLVQVGRHLLDIPQDQL